jgi:NAD dependent epimerase/dehydratase family enzyme
VPDFAVTALLGEGATVVLQGQKVKPNAALAAGYKFKYERIDDALQNILR